MFLSVSVVFFYALGFLSSLKTTEMERKKKRICRFSSTNITQCSNERLANLIWVVSNEIIVDDLPRVYPSFLSIVDESLIKRKKTKAKDSSSIRFSPTGQSPYADQYSYVISVMRRRIINRERKEDRWMQCPKFFFLLLYLSSSMICIFLLGSGKQKKTTMFYYCYY